MSTVQEILSAAASLPEGDRIHIIEGLFATLDGVDEDPDDVHEAWLAIARERAADVDNGNTQMFSWKEISNEAERRLNERKEN